MLNKQIEDAVRAKAHELGMDEAALLAVVDTESAGEAFWQVDGEKQPIIRFEGHYFYARLAGKARQKALQAGLASPKVGGVPNPTSGSQRYAMLKRAIEIDKDAALESTSWGLGQVMGANWKDLGRASVDELVQDSYDLSGQIDLMTDFIEANGLDAAIIRHDWKAFAKGYNGKNYAINKYDVKLAKAYKKYSSKSSDEVAEDDVKQLQVKLNAVLGTKIAIDGDYGPETTRAVKDFQIKMALNVDGLAGPLTKAELDKAYKAKGKVADKAIGGSTLGLGGIGTAVSDATGMLEPLQDYSIWIKGLFIALVFVGVFFTFKSVFFK